METKEKINYGSIGILLSLIIGMGISVMPDDTHVCIEDNVTMHCERLSGTERTCYPSSDTTKGKKLCSGTWQPIINDSIHIEPIKPIETNSLKQVCDRVSCKEI